MSVEWYVDAGDAQNVRKLRWAVNEYLADRASADSDLATAALVVTELVGNVHVHARGPATVRLEWCGELPTLTLANLGPEFAPEITAPDPLAESAAASTWSSSWSERSRSDTIPTRAFTSLSSSRSDAAAMPRPMSPRRHR